MNRDKQYAFLVFCLLVTSTCYSQEQTNSRRAAGFGAQDEDDDMVMRKKATCRKLVEEAVQYFQNPHISVGKACHDFADEMKWRSGEIRIFIFGQGGECYLAEPRSHIWQDFYDEKDKNSQSFIIDMLAQSEKGGWILYRWNNDTQHAYVKTVIKQGKRYIIGAGFYPESAKYRAQELVTTAVRMIGERGASAIFSEINNPFGAFVRGDIYLLALDMQGNALAHGNNIAYVGQSMYDWQDDDGNYPNHAMLKIAQSQDGNGWHEYKEHKMRKRSYVQAVTDPKTKKQYAIIGGYYPDLDDEVVKTFVKKAINYLKTNGKKVALSDFSNQAGDFVPGPLRLFVYDTDGTMLADSQNPGFVGQNLRNAKDSEGKYITRRIIDEANAHGKAWVSFRDKNAYKDVYVEKISVPDGDFIIGAGYWPSSKQRAVKSLVDKAQNFLNSHPIEEALNLFTSGDSDFLRGDLNIFMYDSQDYCMAYGPSHEFIWLPANQIIPAKDTRGQQFFQNVRDVARGGGGWVEYPLNNATRRVYVKEVKKNRTVSGQEMIEANKPAVLRSKNLVIAQQPPQLDVESYIVGSGYYL